MERTARTGSRLPELGALDLRHAQAQAALSDADHALTVLLVQAQDWALELGLAEMPLSQLQDWAEKRQKALALAADLAAAADGVDDALTQQDQAARALAQALGGHAGDAAPDPNYEALRAAALARVDAAEQRRAARRLLGELRDELALRQDVAASAKAALDQWQQDWNRSTQDSIFAGRPADPDQMGPQLDLLTRLDHGAEKHAALQERIQKMAANRDDFRVAAVAVLEQLGLPPQTDWAWLLAALSHAQDAQKQHQDLTAALQVETDAETEDQLARAENDAKLQALGAELGFDPGGALDLRAHLGQARHAAQLRAQIKDLKAALAQRPAPDMPTDAGADGGQRRAGSSGAAGPPRAASA